MDFHFSYLNLFQINAIYADAIKIQNDTVHHTLSQIWIKCPNVYSKYSDEATSIELDFDENGQRKRPAIPEGEELKNLPSHFYVNRVSGKSQWATPYYSNSYQGVDVDLPSFQKAILQRDIIPKW